MSLNIINTNYNLAAIGNYLVSPNKKVVGHYNNLSFRNGQWELYDDQRFSVIQIKDQKKKMILPHVMFYIKKT